MMEDGLKGVASEVQTIISYCCRNLETVKAKAITASIKKSISFSMK